MCVCTRPLQWRNATARQDVGAVVLLMYGGSSYVGDTANSTQEYGEGLSVRGGGCKDAWKSCRGPSRSCGVWSGLITRQGCGVGCRVASVCVAQGRSLDFPLRHPYDTQIRPMSRQLAPPPPTHTHTFALLSHAECVCA